MTRFAALILLGLAACATGPEPKTFSAAQAIVDKAADGFDGLVRLTIHAVPTGGDRCRVVASTASDKLNQWSDPEDLEAIETKVPISLAEGDNLDYTVPVLDASGAVVAVVGVTVSGSGESGKVASAQLIASEVSSAILSARQPLW